MLLRKLFMIQIMNAQQFLQSIVGIRRQAPKSIYLPLTARKNSQLSSINLGGNKLISGPAGSGVTFLTKYIIRKGYANAKILFTDANNHFGWYHDDFKPWFTPVNRYQWPGEDTTLKPWHSNQWLSEPDSEFPNGLTVIDLSEARLFTGELYRTKIGDFLQALLLQFSCQPYNPDQPTILVLDLIWVYLFHVNASSTNQPLVDLFLHVIKTNRKYNRELWLLDDGGFYYSIESMTKAQLDVWHQTSANLDHICLLQNHAHWNYFETLFPVLFGLNKMELDLFKSAGRDLNPSLPYHHEVFIKSSTATQVYGIISPPDETKIYGWLEKIH